MRTTANTHVVKVWDLPIRLFHWLLAALIIALAVTGQLGLLQLHMALGPLVLVLVLFRLVWGVVGSETARFSHFVRGPAAVLAYVAAARAGTARSVGHNPLGAFSVLALLALAGAQAATGLFTSDDVLSEGPLAHLLAAKTVALVSTVHRVGFNVLLAFVVLHLAAVLFYRLVKHDDLVRAMITGTKQVPVDVQGIRFRAPFLALAIVLVAAGVVYGVLAAFPAPALY